MCTIFVSTGKSALHWAAAVNNVEAAVVLLKNGANKDMQNNKVKQSSDFFLKQYGKKEQNIVQLQNT